jgi:HEAT repeat protein
LQESSKRVAAAFRDRIGKELVMKTLCGILVLIVLATASLRAEDTLAANIYKRGYDALLKERWTEAREAFEEVVRDHPKSSWAGGAQVYLCGIKERTGVPSEEAFDCYQAYLAIHTNGTWADGARRQMIGIARRLASSGNLKFQSYMKTLLQSSDEGTQYALLTALYPVENDTALASVWEIYDRSQSLTVRGLALFMVANPPFPQARPKLIQIAQKDPDARLREAATGSLTKVGGEESVRALMAIVRSNDTLSVRKAALSGLATVHPGNAIPFYVEWAKNPDAGVLRKEAVYGLGLVRSKEAGEALLQLLRESPYPDVRRAVLAQYVGWQSGSPVEEIAHLLKSERDVEVRVAAVAALGIPGNDAGVPILVDVIRGKDPEKVRSTARLALSRIGTVKAKSALVGAGSGK